MMPDIFNKGDIVRVNENFPAGNMDDQMYLKFGIVGKMSYDFLGNPHKVIVWMYGHGAGWFWPDELNLIHRSGG